MGKLDAQSQEEKAVNRVKAIMARPIASEVDYESGAWGSIFRDGTPIYFNPWDIFPAVYGTYSSDFDDCALDVLQGLLSRGVAPTPAPQHGLASEMFKEMLCVACLANYGTSPRVCFPTLMFKQILPELIKLWTEHRQRMWENPYG